jgi:AraC family transcriptional activator of pyochelin receptor
MRDPPHLSALAQYVGLNSQKLNRGFRHIFGSTVYSFLQDYRLEEAYRLLSTSEMSVSEVAYHVGYGPAHFATAFRERFGVSPSQMR